MKKAKKLEFKRLLKELDFIETDYEYRTEIVSEADSEFMSSINEFLSNNKELKEIYDKIITDKIDKSIKEKIDSIDKEELNSEELNKELEQEAEQELEKDDLEKIQKEDKSAEVKRVYREIVKMTHADKVNDKRLNDIYIKSTELYNNNDKIGLYKICDELGIDYKLDENDTDIIEDKITDLKKKISFLESTFTWKWLNTKDEKLRDKIILDFISMRIKPT
jgi:hypothetical protein